MSREQINIVRYRLASERPYRLTDDEKLMVRDTDRPEHPDDHDEDDRVLHAERFDGMS